MPIEILMPALSPTMTHGNLAKWLKKEGDKVKPGQIIAEIETDKATMEVEAVDEGIIGKILVAEGTQEVPVNELIALMLEPGEDKAALDKFTKSANISTAPAPAEPAKAAAKKEVKLEVTGKQERIFASPIAKRIAANDGIDISAIQGTGPHGRIVKDDVMSAKASGSKTSAAAPYIAPSYGRVAEEYRAIPNNNMRKVIAKRLLESKLTIPHFYLSIECEVDKLNQARAEMNAAAGENPAYKLSVNDFVIKAVAMALQMVPEANSSWTDEAILLYNNVDVSVAVAIDGGLITPVIRNANQKSISQISNEMKQLAARARENKLKPEEFQGGGFSISNLGMYDIKNFSAIVNPPQSAILAVGKAQSKALVKNGQIVAGTTMELTLSCDHRVVDGAVGARFLKEFKKYIENPITMFV